MSKWDKYLKRLGFKKSEPVKVDAVIDTQDIVVTELNLTNSDVNSIEAILQDGRCCMTFLYLKEDKTTPVGVISYLRKEGTYVPKVN
jgi:hypothetical protein